jgi:hypothetical protein
MSRDQELLNTLAEKTQTIEVLQNDLSTLWERVDVLETTVTEVQRMMSEITQVIINQFCQQHPEGRRIVTRIMVDQLNQLAEDVEVRGGDPVIQGKIKDVQDVLMRGMTQNHEEEHPER